MFKISILVTVLCSVIMLYSLSEVYQGVMSYRQAKELNTIREITHDFTHGLKNFMFERGRMNVVLSSQEPISKENQFFISERRRASDEFFHEGFVKMETKYPKEAEFLHKEYDKLKTIRITMDQEAQRPLLQRDLNGKTMWYTSCTEYIELVNASLEKIGVNANTNTNYSNLITSYKELIIHTITFRSIVGNESSILTSAIADKKTISDSEYTALLTLRGQSEQVWSEIENEADMLGSDNITKAVAAVKKEYYGQFRLKQDRVLRLALKGEVYEGASEEISKLSVPALDAIIILADEAIKGINAANQRNLNKETQRLGRGIFHSVVGMLIVIFIPGYLKKKWIKPLDNVIDFMEDLSIGKTDRVIPYVQREDEVGKLAKGVQMLHKSIEKEQALKSELKEAISKLEDLSIKDPLTGLYNRRYLMDRINELEARYRKSKTIFSIIMCDIDHFKCVNDLYGHDSGDLALKETATLISRCCREQDVVARWGGEEFLILLPDTNSSGAFTLAERIRKEMEDLVFQFSCGSYQITMTLGIGQYCEELGIEGTIKKADMALMQGKADGRNRVVLSN